MDVTRTPAVVVPMPLVRTQPHGSAGRAGRASAPTAARPAETPSLWHVLTPEERTFFEQLAQLGPLSYRPGGEGETQPAPTGNRIDVRG